MRRVSRRTATSLLGAPVLVRGIRLGEVEDVLLDPDAARILGLDVLCGDGASRFLPYATAHLEERGIEIDSTLTLLGAKELAFYRDNSRPLQRVPELADAVVEADGALVAPLGTR